MKNCVAVIPLSLIHISVLGTSFTAKDEDIIGADNDYKTLEAALRNEITQIEQTHSRCV